MSVATFNNTMAALTCEIDDRKIYNDIRSEIDISTTTIITDQDATYETTSIGTITNNLLPGYDIRNAASPIELNETIEVYIYSRIGQAAADWLSAEASYCILDEATDQLLTIVCEVTILEKFSDKVKISVTEPGAVPDGIHASVSKSAVYSYQVLPTITHPETNTKTVTIQSTDATSIAKYGRRVMNLTWPLGQTQNQMQSLIDGYLALYKDPRPYLSMTLQGKNDTLIQQILTRKVSDAVTIINDRLGLLAPGKDFFINSVNVIHDCHDVLTGNYVLEEIPAIQSVPIFKLDISELDGTHVLG